MRRLLLAPALAVVMATALAEPAAAPNPAPFVQAVEFPYYLYPRTLWERELVWLKNIGIGMVEFSVPWNWHQTAAGEYDFTGRTSPRRDLLGLVRTLRKLGLKAWIRPLPPVPGWRNAGWPDGTAPGGAAQRAWLKQLSGLLATHTVSHGGPVAYVEGKALAIDAAAPPAPVAVVNALDPAALARSREAMTGAAGPRGSLLWTGVEDAVYPEGWAAGGAPHFRKGAVGLTGEERPGAAALRRGAALLRGWAPLVSRLRPAVMPQQAGGKLPEGVRAAELVSQHASAVSITNRGATPFQQDLRVRWPGGKRTLQIPGVHVPAGESLWLPLAVSLGPEGPCRECTNFSAAEHLVYATAELISMEYENGVLAMEFSAPAPGEAVLQLARKAAGPYLAAGKPTEFDWDEKALRARLPIPAGTGAARRVRIGIAVEEPDAAAFFNDPRRLLIGKLNVVPTTYSSAALAARSRLRTPAGLTSRPAPKSPNEIDYELTVPADAIHGEYVNLTLEADGAPLGRARVQLVRPAGVRLGGALQLEIGADTELTPDPPIAPVEPKAGTTLDVLIRNNSAEIRTYHVEAAGEALEFFPAKSDITVGAGDERAVSLRVLGKEGAGGLCDFLVRVTGAAEIDAPMRALLLPRNRTVAWSADLDGDGAPEWVLETQRVRAVFSTYGRWTEFTWKDGGGNFLREAGEFAGSAPLRIRAAGDALEMGGEGWTRTIRLADSTLTVEQTTPLPSDRLAPERLGNIGLAIDRVSPNKVVYSLK